MTRRSARMGIVLAGIAAGLASRPASAAMLRLDSRGLLLGANDVDVDGVLYDVTFASSPCDALPGSIPGSIAWDCGDLTFSDGPSAAAAGQALLDQVLVDGPAGAFDSSPEFVNGCQTFGRTDSCYIMIPYGVDSGAFLNSILLVASVLNASPSFPDPDGVTTYPYEILQPIHLAVPITSVEFRLASAAPEPSMLLLLGVSCLALGLRRRRGGHRPRRASP